MTKDFIIKKLEIEKRFFAVSFLFIMLIMIGGVSNTLAVENNGGKMPVYSFYVFSDKHHFSYSDPKDVNLWALTDTIQTFNYTWSIGDFLMVASFLVFLSNGIFCCVKLYKHERSIKNGRNK